VTGALLGRVVAAAAAGGSGCDATETSPAGVSADWVSEFAAARLLCF